MRNLKGKTRANACTQTQKRFTKGEIVKQVKGITLIALVITMIVPYDKNLKHSNINRFHYLQYIKNNKKIENIIKMSLKTCLFYI